MNRSWIYVICAISACWGPPTDEQRCQGGDGRACMRVGEDYASGVLHTADPKRALDFFRKGCDLNDAESCLKVAVARRQGEGGVVDQGAAQKAFSKACDLGNINGCRDFADALEAMGNTTGARAARAKGCKLGDDEACNMIDTPEGT